LLRQREPIYREIADVVVDTGQRAPASVARDIATRLKALSTDETLNVELGRAPLPDPHRQRSVAPAGIAAAPHHRQPRGGGNERDRWPLYLDTLLKQLTTWDPVCVVLPDGEVYKTLDVLNNIFTALLKNHCDRRRH